MLTVRPAGPEDIPAIMAVLEAARGIMRASGNLRQWVDGYPSEAVGRNDIQNSSLGVGPGGNAQVKNPIQE